MLTMFIMLILSCVGIYFSIQKIKNNENKALGIVLLVICSIPASILLLIFVIAAFLTLIGLP